MPPPAYALEFKSGVDCRAGFEVKYRVSGGYVLIDDMIVAEEEDIVARGCVPLPRSLFDSEETTALHPASPEAFHRDATLWPGGVVRFQLDPQLEKTDRDAVRWAVNHISANTPIVFVEGPADRQIVFQSNPQLRKENSCGISHVGMQLDRNNVIQLAGCEPGVAVHEILHALGMIHAHQRPDRDDYVDVASCVSGIDYDKTDIRPFGEYDYASIMHYGRNAGCANSLVPKQAFSIPLPLCNSIGRVTETGQRCSLSVGDVSAIWHFYRESMPTRQLSQGQLASLHGVIRNTLEPEPAPSPGPQPAGDVAFIHCVPLVSGALRYTCSIAGSCGELPCSANAWLPIGGQPTLPPGFFEAGSERESAIQVTPIEIAGSIYTLVNKDVGGQRWAIVQNRSSGIVTGTVFDAPGASNVQFIFCSEVNESLGVAVFGGCFVAGPCSGTGCRPSDWISIAGNPEIGAAFFAPGAGRSSGLQLTPPGREILITKDLGMQRWTITTLVGRASVDFPLGLGPAFGNIFEAPMVEATAALVPRLDGYSETR